MEQAKAYAAIELHLTSNPMRVATNKLCHALGFQKKETNCYHMTISECTFKSSDIDSVKQNITYLIGKERAEGKIEPLTLEYDSRMLDVPLDDVEKCMDSL